MGGGAYFGQPHQVGIAGGFGGPQLDPYQASRPPPPFWAPGSAAAKMARGAESGGSENNLAGALPQHPSQHHGGGSMGKQLTQHLSSPRLTPSGMMSTTSPAGEGSRNRSAEGSQLRAVAPGSMETNTDDGLDDFWSQGLEGKLKFGNGRRRGQDPMETQLPGAARLAYEDGRHMKGRLSGDNGIKEMDDGHGGAANSLSLDPLVDAFMRGRKTRQKPPGFEEQHHPEVARL